MTTQQRLRAEVDKQGYVILSGAGEHAAARALERKGLVKVDDISEGLHGPNAPEPRMTAWSLAPEWAGDHAQKQAKAALLRAASRVTINKGVRPYGGRKMVLVRFDEENDTVIVQMDTKAGNSMIGADHRSYRFDEVEFAR